MKAYGSEHQKFFFTSDEPGAPTRHRKLSSKCRSESRRLLHKSGRNHAKYLISQEVDEMDKQVDNFEEKPCTFCGRMLKSALPDGDWSTLQPYGGGEVQFHFCYGSNRFDYFPSAVFRGLICDDCGERYIDRMTSHT